jgi:prepilin-type N-terminal cleavage/methylation domain-containing protein
MAKMWRAPFREGRAGFTLVELAVVLLVLALLASGLAVPIAAQLQMRRHDEVQRQMEHARDALLGFAAAHGRLPCPALEASHGQESFATGGDAVNGECADFHGGLLPGAALGLAPLDDEGFVRDPWASARNRIRYAVSGVAVNGVRRALTRANGLQSATLAGVGDAPHYLFVCASGAGANASGCGAAANHLTRKAAFVLLSLGPNAASAAPAGDEARNVDGDAVFVSRDPSDVVGREFDDVVQWVSIHLVVHRLLSAGRLP